METATPYLGFTSSKEYCSWLCNALDLASLKYISKTGHHLFEQELSTAVKDLYADELEKEVSEEVPEVDSDEEWAAEPLALLKRFAKMCGFLVAAHELIMTLVPV